MEGCRGGASGAGEIQPDHAPGIFPHRGRAVSGDEAIRKCGPAPCGQYREGRAGGQGKRPLRGGGDRCGLCGRLPAAFPGKGDQMPDRGGAGAGARRCDRGLLLLQQLYPAPPAQQGLPGQRLHRQDHSQVPHRPAGSGGEGLGGDRTGADRADYGPGTGPELRKSVPGERLLSGPGRGWEGAEEARAPPGKAGPGDFGAGAGGHAGAAGAPGGDEKALRPQGGRVHPGRERVRGRGAGAGHHRGGPAQPEGPARGGGVRLHPQPGRG